jgi:hypothetical protein
MEFQILSGKEWKTWSTATTPVHQDLAAFKVDKPFLLKPVRKT